MVYVFYPWFFPSRGIRALRSSNCHLLVVYVLVLASIHVGTYLPLVYPGSLPCFGFFEDLNMSVVGGNESATTHPPRNQSTFHSRWKTKSIKALDYKRQYVLGCAIFLNKVKVLCCRAVIGRLEYCTMSKDEWVDWATIH